MKRLTALVLAGVLVFGTSCGGNQTNSGEAQAGAAAQEQTADDAEVTADGATDSSADYADDEQGGTKPSPLSDYA